MRRLRRLAAAMMTVALVTVTAPMTESSARAASQEGIEGTIGWALNLASTHATTVDGRELVGWCLLWVEIAYQGAGTGSAWDYFKTNGQQHPGDAPSQAPRGALVFFPPTSGNPYGHVGISLGSSKMVSMLDAASESGVWVTDIWSSMAGWMTPPDNWPGRPGWPNQNGGPATTPTPAPQTSAPQGPSVSLSFSGAISATVTAGDGRPTPICRVIAPGFLAEVGVAIGGQQYVFQVQAAPYHGPGTYPSSTPGNPNQGAFLNKAPPQGLGLRSHRGTFTVAGDQRSVSVDLYLGDPGHANDNGTHVTGTFTCDLRS